jgi:hypothetical protein
MALGAIPYFRFAEKRLGSPAGRELIH